MKAKYILFAIGLVWLSRTVSAAAGSALRPKRCLLALNRTVRNLVASKLVLDWSPEQISGWLKDEFPGDESMRRPHRIAAHQETRGQIPEAVSIRERPAEAEDRAVPGHWEGDLISGSKNSHIVTLVERHSRFTALIKVSDKETATVIGALTRQIRRLPTSLRRSLTWDRGHEMAKHKLFTVATNVKVYFCDPSSPWQRGSNENTNGLLRQYFPKGTDLSSHSQADLDKVALRLNQRPRETLGFKTPAAKLQVSVATTR